MPDMLDEALDYAWGPEEIDDDPWADEDYYNDYREYVDSRNDIWFW